jgi:hypothetical protein
MDDDSLFFANNFVFYIEKEIVENYTSSSIFDDLISSLKEGRYLMTLAL